ncbi:MAG: primosomal protein N' [Chitinophagales bacterium]|nr:primosomal protein N' [Chitinophagales bacterium]
MLFADVILPLPVPGMFTYLVPQEFSEHIAIGKRVVVQFGARKIYTALVGRLHNNQPELHKAKPILEVLDDEPVVHPHNIEFWKWIASYYLCTLGEVMNAAMPQGLKLDSETNIALHPEWDEDESKLDNAQFLVMEALRIKKSLSVQQLEKLTRRKTVHALIKSLIEKNAVYAFEKLVEKYKPKTENYIELAAEYSDEELLNKTLDELNKAKRQQEALMAFLQAGAAEIKKSKLIETSGISSAALKQLIQKGILHEQKKEVDRLTWDVVVSEKKEYILSEVQQKSLHEIKTWFEKKDVVLLHGVTSSGKTQLYMELIKEALANGKQALYLLPEIALTTQLVRRLREVFGETIGIYHSKFTANERVEIWNKLLRKEYKAVIGARSALFLPFSELGLVIVDEEHDPSYKQFDPAPRYQARDAAIYLAHDTGAKVLLGTGTPSLESYENARHGKYGFVKLTERFGGVQLPRMEIVNLREETKKHKMQSDFSSVLLEEIKATLVKKEQVILFQNRRGFAPYLSCYHCGWIPKCVNCDVSLSYHKHLNTLRCHYCGYATEVVNKCVECESTDIRIRGFGTEKIEEEIKIFFPDAGVMRLDLDAARSREAYEQIIADFENRKFDILVGTQMVTKGLDFDTVSLVGILSADQLLGFPDFRANERGFQLIQQVSGRAGRKGHASKVLIQTFDAEHPVLDFILKNDFENFFYREMNFRKEFDYPPYTRLIHLVLKHKERKTVQNAARDFARLLAENFQGTILGPVTPPISMMKNLYLQDILLKIPKTAALNANKHALVQSIEKLKLKVEYKSVRVDVDVDP